MTEQRARELRSVIENGKRYHTAKTQFSELCELRLLLDRFSLER